MLSNEKKLKLAGWYIVVESKTFTKFARKGTKDTHGSDKVGTEAWEDLAKVKPLA